ncbi:putative RNA-directed DNA polymerase, eukaryota, reverse transcriptase zinc-binding domain protein [Tanacetum coccineum]
MPKCINNPFEKDVDKIATSFFATNFPESLDAKGLWKEFQPFRRIVDAFIANKRSEIDKPSFTSVASRGGGVNRNQNNVNQDKGNYITLSEHGLITVDDSSTVVLVKVNEVGSISNMYRICRNEGFDDVKIHYARGLWVWIQFNNAKSCKAFKSNKALQNVWRTIRAASTSFIVDERMVWIKVGETKSTFPKNEVQDNVKVGDHEVSNYTGCKRSFRKMINGIGIQETMDSKLELFNLKSIWGNFKFDYACNMARGKWLNSTDNYYLINVYGPQHQPDKAYLWESLRIFAHQHVGHIILFGDLNEVRHENERFGTTFSSNDALIFNSFIDNVGLIDLPLGGKMYTWMNKLGTKLSKLDRFLVSDGVLNAHPHLQATVLDKVWSDHNPILLHCKYSDFGPIPFKLFHSWFDRKGFDDTVKEVWNSNSTGCANDEDRQLRVNKLLELEDLDKLESMDLIQKARLKWDVEGDENSKFFHGIINSKRKSQMINGILHEGEWITDPKDIKTAFLNFYKAKFSCHDSPVIFPPIVVGKRLCDSDRRYLDSMVSLEEIKDAVWDCGSQKAPGPDGFSFLFVKKYWDLVSHDIQNFVNGFFASGKFPPGSNSSFFTLIPKVPNPLYIKDFRPISLIGVHYKIIAKILANRLSKVIDSIISPEQSAFILGRQILDGPLILSEVINWYKKWKKKMMLFKVDFEKAFDSVSWRFLDYIMDKLGFSSQWRSWIKAGLIYYRASILVNGSPASEFSLKRGLRQGDPLSPFRFIIVMEGLNIMLKDGLAANLFRGIKIGSSSVHISHLFYAYDVIIFSKWNQSDMDNIIRILDVFFLASGLKININKSNLYGVGVSSVEVANMAEGTCCSSSSLPFSYLGLPIGSNMGRITIWTTLIDRFKARLSGWKANMLSSGGRLTLIKLVLGSLDIYYFSIFKAPEAVIKQLESLRASFFWGASGGFELIDCQSSGLWARIIGSIFQLHSSDVPLCSHFNRLFHLDRDKNCLVKDRFATKAWSWNWFRPINGGRVLADLNSLFMELGSVNLSNKVDSVSSSLSSDGSYSVSDVRKHIDDCLLLNPIPCTRWCKVIPRKVNIFMWRLFLDRLPHRLNLSLRGLDIDYIMCPLCNNHVESNVHVFFSCYIARDVWSLVRGWCDSKFHSLSSCDDWDVWYPSWKASKDLKNQAYVIFASSC